MSRKNPHAHKNKIGTSTPPSKKTQKPPLKGGILWAWGFSPAERTPKCQAPIKLAQPFPAQNCGQKFYGHRAFSDMRHLQGHCAAQSPRVLEAVFVAPTPRMSTLLHLGWAMRLRSCSRSEIFDNVRTESGTSIGLAGGISHSQFSHTASLMGSSVAAFFQGKTKGQQLKGKIVS